jgi:hypothetical protein
VGQPCRAAKKQLNTPYLLRFCARTLLRCALELRAQPSLQKDSRTQLPKLPGPMLLRESRCHPSGPSPRPPDGHPGCLCASEPTLVWPPVLKQVAVDCCERYRGLNGDPNVHKPPELQPWLPSKAAHICKPALGWCTPAGNTIFNWLFGD